MERINPRTTPAARAAELLAERYGDRWQIEASNRADRAQTEATANYYENVGAHTAVARKSTPVDVQPLFGDELPEGIVEFEIIATND